jgi:integrase
MAGVRGSPRASGRYEAWYTDYTGRRRFITGTRSRAETLHVAQGLEHEHRMVRLGYKPKPTSVDKHRHQLCIEVLREYLAWGESQGGRGGKPWSKIHAQKTRRYLEWWRERLGLVVVSDLDDILMNVEKNIRELQKAGKSGKTLANVVAALRGFCNWAIKRGILSENPLRHIGSFDMTPRVERRALTVDEVRKLVEVAPEHRALLYETAFLSGLRAGELRSLSVNSLDMERGGLRLDGSWTKNRKAGFQPLPFSLMARLKAFGEARTAARLYRRAYSRRDAKLDVPDNPLLFVPTHPTREMEKDLRVAGIPKYALGGKVDFHALRVAFVTFVIEAGASVVEAQRLARHATPTITMKLYARARESRLSQLTEKVSEVVFPTMERGYSVGKAPESARQTRRNAN